MFNTWFIHNKDITTAASRLCTASCSLFYAVCWKRNHTSRDSCLYASKILTHQKWSECFIALFMILWSQLFCFGCVLAVSSAWQAEEAKFAHLGLFLPHQSPKFCTSTQVVLVGSWLPRDLSESKTPMFMMDSVRYEGHYAPDTCHHGP